MFCMKGLHLAVVSKEPFRSFSHSWLNSPLLSQATYVWSEGLRGHDIVCDFPTKLARWQKKRGKFALNAFNFSVNKIA